LPTTTTTQTQGNAARAAERSLFCISTPRWFFKSKKRLNLSAFAGQLKSLKKDVGASRRQRQNCKKKRSRERGREQDRVRERATTT